MDGKQLLQFTQKLYNKPNVTWQDLQYAMLMLNPIAYICQHHTVKGHNVTFTVPNQDYSKSIGHRPWQKGILRATCNPHVRNVCVMKSRQLGISEVGIETLFYLMDRLSGVAPKFLYLFPTQRQMDGFLKSRIQPEMQNPYYNSLVDKSNDSMEQMGLRNSTAFFRTGGSAKGLEGVDIDCILMDEYERYAGSGAEQSGLESLKSSSFLSQGQRGFIRRWSTPSAPEVGIDEKFRQSDQHYWLIKCPYCGHWQIITFKENLRVVNPKDIDHVSRKANPGACKYLCKYCHNDLEAARWYNGHWFCKYPNQGKPKGFFISQLDAVWISPDDIYTDYMNQDTEDFYRYTLGAPYQNTNLKFVPQDVTKHIRVSRPLSYNGDGDVRYIHIVIGIDWGEHFHHAVVLGMRENGKWDIIHLSRIPRSTGTEHIDEDLHAISMLISRFEPDIVCADEGFAGDYVLKLQEAHPNNVYKVKTRSAISNGDPSTKFNDNDMSVTIDKVTQTKIAMEDIKAGKIGFYSPNKDRNLQFFINHWENVIIRKERNENTGQVFETMPSDKQDRPDHFASATTYAIVAMRFITHQLASGAGNLRVSTLNIGNDNRVVNTGIRQKDSDDYGHHITPF